MRKLAFQGHSCASVAAERAFQFRISEGFSGWLPSNYQSVILQVLMVSEGNRAMISLSFWWDLGDPNSPQIEKDDQKAVCFLQQPVIFPRNPWGWDAKKLRKMGNVEPEPEWFPVARPSHGIERRLIL
jgi:hypothetical protein